MKKVMILFAASLIFAACGGSAEQAAQDSTAVDSTKVDSVAVDTTVKAEEATPALGNPTKAEQPVEVIK